MIMVQPNHRNVAAAGGRPRDSGVWEYFKYLVDSDYNECIVINVDAVSKGRVCMKHIAGRSPTNLKSHLQAFHKATYVELKRKDDEQRTALSQNPRPSSANLPSKHCNISEFFNKPSTYPVQSEQHLKRVRAFAKMIVETGIPTTLLNSDFSVHQWTQSLLFQVRFFYILKFAKKLSLIIFLSTYNTVNNFLLGSS